MEKINEQKYANLMIENPENYSSGNVTRAIFLSQKEKIIQLKKSGYPMTAIWKLLTETGEFNKGYGQFVKLYKAIILPILNASNTEQKQCINSTQNTNIIERKNIAGSIKHSAHADSNQLI